ncbi:MAG: outer membrane beta-barrel protein [Ignavibacteria bacterium]|nr:outer membrane beta-barrel protein [Ignavibacteria bacterium]MBI3765636.1 outer membrane beta-barrel protein [Ignavibacteriales bacterium]
MKQVLLIIFLSIAIFSAMVAQEDSTQLASREITISGGLSYPYLPSEFKEIWENGLGGSVLSWNAGIGYGYSFAPGDFGYGAISLTFDYNRFAFNPSGYRDYVFTQYVESDPKLAQEAYTGTIIARGSAKIATAMVNFKGSFSTTKRTVAPYFLIGIGFSYFTSDSVSIAGATRLFTMGADHQSAFSWSVGVGVEVPINECLGVFVQGKSVLGVRDSPRQYFPISAGVRVGI